MKKGNSNLTGELRPKYDLKRLAARRLGPGPKSFGHLIADRVLAMLALRPPTATVRFQRVNYLTKRL